MKNIKLELDSVLKLYATLNHLNKLKIHSQLWSLSNPNLNDLFGNELFHTLWTQLYSQLDSPIQEQLENSI